MRRPALRPRSALVRGPPLDDLGDYRFARDAASRLDELILGAHEGLVDAQLATGAHAEVVAALTGLVRAHPLRERFHAQLILALYRCGRQADALRAYQEARAASSSRSSASTRVPSCRRSSSAVLAQDPALDLAATPAAPTPADRAQRSRRGRRRAGCPLVGRDRELGLASGRPRRRAGRPGRVDAARRRARHRQDPPRRGADATRRPRSDDRGVGPLLRRPRRARVLAVDPDRQRSARPLRPRRVPRRARVPTSASWRRSRPRSRSSSPTSSRRRRSIPSRRGSASYRAVSGFIRRLARTRPLVLVVDDLHWADAPSLGLVTFLADRDRRRAVARVGTYRNIDPTLGGALAETLVELSRRSGRAPARTARARPRWARSAALGAAGTRAGRGSASAPSTGARRATRSSSPSCCACSRRESESGSRRRRGRTASRARRGQGRHPPTGRPAARRDRQHAHVRRDPRSGLRPRGARREHRCRRRHAARPPRAGHRRRASSSTTPRARAATGSPTAWSTRRSTTISAPRSGPARITASRRRSRRTTATRRSAPARHRGALVPRRARRAARQGHRRGPAGRAVGPGPRRPPAGRGAARAALELIAGMPEGRRESSRELEVQDQLSVLLIASTSYTDPEFGRVCARVRELCEEVDDHALLVPALWRLSFHHVMCATSRPASRSARAPRPGVRRRHGGRELAGHIARDGPPTSAATRSAARPHFDLPIAMCDAGHDAAARPVRHRGAGGLRAKHLRDELVAARRRRAREQEARDAFAIALRDGHAHWSTMVSFWAASTVSVLRRAARDDRSSGATTGSPSPSPAATGSACPTWGSNRGWAIAALGDVEAGGAQILEGAAIADAFGAVYMRPVFLGCTPTSASWRPARRRAGVDRRRVAAVEATGERWFEAELHRTARRRAPRPGPGRTPPAAAFADAIESPPRKGSVAFARRAEGDLAQLA